MITPLDWFVIGLYLAATIAVGVWYGGRQSDAGDYFTGGGKMRSSFQSLLVGLSIAATLFSGISFLAYPSIVYQHGPAVLIGLISFPICWILMRFFFIKRYLKIASIEPYHIIEENYGPVVRTVAATMFLLLRIGWMSALIYAPTIALTGAGDLDSKWFWIIALTIGISSTIYTTVGGIRSVIITDAMQFLVIFGSLLLITGVIFWQLPTSLAEGWEQLKPLGHHDVLRWSTNPSEPFTVWSLIIGFTVANLAAYLADQMSLQRYLSCGDADTAGRSFTINIVGACCVIVLLGVMGLGLGMWYATQAGSVPPDNPDQVFPRFVATQLPAGLTGLVLAALLAATMSSMTSGINTLSATLTLDYRARFGRPMTPSQQLRFAKITSLIVGLAATGLAGVVGLLGDIFDITQTLLGVFLGPLLGCILFSLLRAPLRPAAIVGAMVLGCVTGWMVAFSDAQSLWVAPASLAVVLLCAPLLSLVSILFRSEAKASSLATASQEE